MSAVFRTIPPAHVTGRGFDGVDAPQGAHAGCIRRLSHVMADSLPGDDEQFDDELIESTLGRSTMAVLYGDSNSGKTFAAIDMGAAICLGVPWLGRQCASGMVVYLATEAVESVKRRLSAYQRHHGVRVPGFVIVASPINLFDGEADTAAVVTLVNSLEAEHGYKAVLVIGDTLARMSAGANENSADMAVVMSNADVIRAETGATFLWIHHCGKDQAKGMRGWSGMRAVMDTEIEVSSNEQTGVRVVEITKQRDLPGKGERIGFRLETVLLGVNRWGKPRGSCVVIPAVAPAKVARSGRQSEVARAIKKLLSNYPSGMSKGDTNKHFGDQFAKGSVYRELKKLVVDGRLHESDQSVTLLAKSKGGASK